MKDYETQVKGTILVSGNTNYRIEIKETGVLGEECATSDAAEEFNPWAIKDKDGNWKSQKAMEAGRIQNVDANTDNGPMFMFI